MRISKLLGIALAVAAATAFSAGANAATTVRISHTQIESHPHHLGCVAFKEAVEKKLGDKYDIQIYPNAQLGPNEKVLELVKMGSIQMLVIATSNIEQYDKIYGVFSIPFLFTSEKAYEQFITQPDLMGKLGVNAKTVGFRPLAAYIAGTRSFYSTSPIRSVADLDGKKFRVMSGPTNVKMMEAFGASAAPMAFGEVYSALQQGVIDGAENNELALTQQKHGEVCKYYSNDGHQMFPDLLVGSEKFLESLPPEDLKVFQEAALESQKIEFDAWHKSTEEARAEAKGMGVEFISVDANEFRQKVLPLHEELMKENPEQKEIYEAASAFNASHQ